MGLGKNSSLLELDNSIYSHDKGNSPTLIDPLTIFQLFYRFFLSKLLSILYVIRVSRYDFTHSTGLDGNSNRQSSFIFFIHDMAFSFM